MSAGLNGLWLLSACALRRTGQFGAAALLLTAEAADWSARKGALWWFARRPRNGAEETVLRAVIAPDLE